MEHRALMLYDHTMSSLSRPLLLLLPDVLLCAALSRRMGGLLWGGPTLAAALTHPAEGEGEVEGEVEGEEVEVV